MVERFVEFCYGFLLKRYFVRTFLTGCVSLLPYMPLPTLQTFWRWYLLSKDNREVLWHIRKFGLAGNILDDLHTKILSHRYILCKLWVYGTTLYSFNESKKLRINLGDDINFHCCNMQIWLSTVFFLFDFFVSFMQVIWLRNVEFQLLMAH